jgi:hypothetical protein
MQGGSISGNRIEINTNVSSGVNDYVYGCGVQVGASGLSTFTMTGGSISGNSIARTNSSGGAMFHAYGAGVAVRSGSSVTGQVGGSIAYNTITNVGGNNTIAGLSVWIEGVGNTDSNLTPGTNWP